MAEHISIEIEYDNEVILECMHCHDYIVIAEGTDQHTIAKVWIPMHLANNDCYPEFQLAQHVKVRTI